ncbi:MAG: QueT transporter family protein [Candidatus Bathyarchaeia archaeon]|jgi:energy-coupling factor transport system substrate-specific component
MIDLLEMWKKPKMIAFVILTAVVYEALVFPTQGFTIFGGHADFGRVGVGIPVAFSFLFGPAAAWGAAIGNIIRDIITGGLDLASISGFIGNFLIGYLPYKLWSKITSEKPDMRSLKKVGLFIGLAAFSCVLCGLLIGAELDWLGYAPFIPTAPLIGLSNSLWAVTLGPIVLALAYPYVSKKKLLYTDLLNEPQKNSKQVKAAT